MYVLSKHMLSAVKQKEYWVRVGEAVGSEPNAGETQLFINILMLRSDGFLCICRTAQHTHTDPPTFDLKDSRCRMRHSVETVELFSASCDAIYFLLS